ncbi:MAG: hypothetical protein RLZZ200_974 [Pseudomonadota bacterium]|jgi:4-hydroxy-tetrahydrodipicolinate synthase
MPAYTRDEARSWARKALRGVANVVIPTMTRDFAALNEQAARHDVEHCIAQGFVGTLACSEVAIALPEYTRFVEVMAEQAAELVLLGYPPYFHPKTLDDIYDYTKAFCDATDLAVMLFPIPTWGFSRLSPIDMPVPLLRRLVDDCPNVVAIKAEGGAPFIMGAIEVHRAFGEEVVISFPLEHEFTPLAQLIDVPFCGTNFSAYFGPALPRIFRLLQERRFDEATAEFHRLDPARRAFAAVPQAGNGLINRMM